MSSRNLQGKWYEKGALNENEKSEALAYEKKNLLIFSNVPKQALPFGPLQV